MKRIASEILSLQITDVEKIELMLDRMVGSGNLKFKMTFLNMFDSRATPEQRAAFIKLYEMGWNVKKVVWHNTEPKMAFAVNTKECAAWVTPDGKLNRAPMGKSTAYLDKNWVSND